MDATRSIMLVGAIGLGAAVLLSLPEIMPRAVAEEEPMRTLFRTPSEVWPPAFDPDRLMRWDYYVQPGVSIEPVKETVVRKIGYGKTTFTSGWLAPYWLFVLGGLFVLVTLLLPRGIVGSWRHLWAKHRERRQAIADGLAAADAQAAPKPAE